MDSNLLIETTAAALNIKKNQVNKILDYITGLVGICPRRVQVGFETFVNVVGLLVVFLCLVILHGQQRLLQYGVLLRERNW